MFSAVVRPVRNLVEALTDDDAPQRLALGVALGMLVGLVPKGNLTAAVLAVLALSVRANLAAVIGSAGVFTLLGAWTDPLAHDLGLRVLTRPGVQPLGAWLYDLPLVPWTGLNNTVVFGSLLLGLVLFWPVYYLVWHGCQRWRPWLAARLARYRVRDALLLVEAAPPGRKR